MAKYLLAIRKSELRSYGKGEVVEILEDGVSPGTDPIYGTSGVYWYAEVTAANRAALLYLKDKHMDSALDNEGNKYHILAKRKASLPDDETDKLNSDWENPVTIPDLGAITLTQK